MNITIIGIRFDNVLSIFKTKKQTTVGHCCTTISGFFLYLTRSCCPSFVYQWDELYQCQMLIKSQVRGKQTFSMHLNCLWVILLYQMLKLLSEVIFVVGDTFCDKIVRQRLGHFYSFHKSNIPFIDLKSCIFSSTTYQPLICVAQTIASLKQ